MDSRPPPMAQLVSQCVYLRPAVKICGYPELPSILCFIRLSCDSFSYQDQPDVSQPRKSCLATPSWTNHEIETIMDKSLDQIDTISDQSSLPYSQILVKLSCFSLPNKPVQNFNRYMSPGDLSLQTPDVVIFIIFLQCSAYCLARPNSESTCQTPIRVLPKNINPCVFM